MQGELERVAAGVLDEMGLVCGGDTDVALLVLRHHQQGVPAPAARTPPSVVWVPPPLVSRSPVRRTAALPLLALLLLAACGGSSSPAAGGKGGTPLPTVSGSYGDKPGLSFPGADPSTTEQVKVLREGTGPTVGKGDLLVADYFGQIWKGAVFDNSYDRGAAADFPIGVGKVVPGWDDLLVGVKAGSRILMTLPPDKGYGASGNTQAGIKGTDTLVFVVDIIGSYSDKAAAGLKTIAEKAAPAGITITGLPGTAPKLTVAKGAASPKAVTVTVLARGTGAKVVGGLCVVAYEAVDFTGASAGSTWTTGTPAGAKVNPTGSAGPFDLVRGLPLGSRVLIQVPKQGKQQAIAVVVDLIAQPTTAKAAG